MTSGKIDLLQEVLGEIHLVRLRFNDKFHLAVRSLWDYLLNVFIGFTRQYDAIPFQYLVTYKVHTM